MNLGVLLLNCQAGRATTFTREWAARAIGRVADYMFAQSGGRETITFNVFDWITLPQTQAELVALGYDPYSKLRPAIELALDARLGAPAAEAQHLDPYTHILIGIDHPQSSGGTTPGAVTYLAATNFTPSFVVHELGHRYGASDAFRETAGALVRYENRYCVMGALGWPAVFVDSVLTDSTAPMLDQSGPGMSVPTLLATGWLNESEHGLALDLTGTNLSSSGGVIRELSALAGAPSPGWSRPPVVIRYRDLVVEYRHRDGWDRGLPDPGTGVAGWVVVHRSAPGTPSAVYVDSVAARPGAILALGKDNPLDIFNPGPLRLSVLSCNAEARTVRLKFSRRGGRAALSGTTYGGVEVGGGGWVWTPGNGLTPVPPHSPLFQVLEAVARVQALQELLAIASGDDVAGLVEEASLALRTLQRSAAELRVEASISPLAQALESISQLHATSERLTSSTDEKEVTQEFVEASRQRLAQVKRTLANAVEEERQR